MRKTLARAPLVTLAALAFAGPASAQYARHGSTLCLDEQHPIQGPRIVPGCALIDCCPGCPGRWPIDWRIRVDGPDLGHVELRFLGLSDADRAALEATGSAQWLAGARDHRIAVRGREAFVRGFRFADGARLPHARLELVPDAARMEAFRTARPTPGGAAPTSLTIRIDQILDRTVVNRLIWEVTLRVCPKLDAQTTDHVELQNLIGTADAVVLVDGKRSGVCVDDEQFTGTGLVPVGNLTTPTGCRSELAVFAKENAFALVENVSGFTPGAGDTVPVALAPVLEVPVALWLLRPGANTDADDDFKLANLRFTEQRTGIRFTVAVTTDLSSDPGAIALVGGDLLEDVGTKSSRRLAMSAHHDLTRLNVYYVDASASWVGWYSYEFRNVILIDKNANDTTLAHEFGHALSLSHSANMPDMLQTNLMSNGVFRDHFTLGQVFRAHAHPWSVLLLLGIRTGPLRACWHPFGDSACPVESLKFVVTP